MQSRIATTLLYRRQLRARALVWIVINSSQVPSGASLQGLDGTLGPRPAWPVDNRKFFQLAMTTNGIGREAQRFARPRTPPAIGLRRRQ